MLQQAQNNVQTMSMNANALNNLSVKVANDATSTVYLIDSIRAAFSISGAVDEDHRQLHNLQNEAEQLLVSINSINSEVNDDSARQQQYLVSAQNQIGNLNTAIRVGSFRNAAPAPAPRPVLFGSKAASRNTQTAAASAAAVRSGKPLFVAKFKNDNVSYKEGLSTAVKAAVNRKSNTVLKLLPYQTALRPAKRRNMQTKSLKKLPPWASTRATLT